MSCRAASSVRSNLNLPYSGRTLAREASAGGRGCVLPMRTKCVPGDASRLAQQQLTDRLDNVTGANGH